MNSWVGHIVTHKGPLYLKLQQRIIHIKNIHFLISTVTADDLSLLGVRALVGTVTVIFGSFMGMFMGPTLGRVRLPEWCVGGNLLWVIFHIWGLDYRRVWNESFTAWRESMLIDMDFQTWQWMVASQSEALLEKPCKLTWNLTWVCLSSNPGPRFMDFVCYI